jgi:hypothetical protein
LGTGFKPIYKTAGAHRKLEHIQKNTANYLSASEKFGNSSNQKISPIPTFRINRTQKITVAIAHQRLAFSVEVSV